MEDFIPCGYLETEPNTKGGCFFLCSISPEIQAMAQYAWLLSADLYATQDIFMFEDSVLFVYLTLNVPKKIAADDFFIFYLLSFEENKA